MAIDTKSRWNRAQIIHFRDRFGKPLRRPHFDVLRRYTAIERPGNRVYRLKQGDDWFNLAGRIYGDEDLGWVLMEFNQVVDPFEELVVGTQIVLPSNFDVEFEVTNFEFAYAVDPGEDAVPL